LSDRQTYILQVEVFKRHASAQVATEIFHRSLVKLRVCQRQFFQARAARDNLDQSREDRWLHLYCLEFESGQVERRLTFE